MWPVTPQRNTRRQLAQSSGLCEDAAGGDDAAGGEDHAGLTGLLGASHGHVSRVQGTGFTTAC